ncbi:hypothetical protein [Microtetraspora fusca]|uniref:hypothetical protein n=1 Tax=Microtetraspora fusca TaxID=1997 RepID=UPI0012FCC853|nr:hypothetical protein [Microtetraspora fusca]
MFQGRPLRGRALGASPRTPWLYPEDANWEIVHYGWAAVLPPALVALGWANRG